MRPDDILLWPGGYWCLRCECSDMSEWGYQYRVIVKGDPEWMTLTDKRVRDSPLSPDK